MSDKKLGAVSSLDLESFSLERQVSVCAGPTSLALDAADSALWVACQHDAAVVRLDVPELTESRRVGALAEPTALALAPDHQRLWVAELGRGALVAIGTHDAGAPLTRWPLTGNPP